MDFPIGQLREGQTFVRNSTGDGWVAAYALGTELGYVEKADADFSTAGVATDVTGMAVTVTVDGSRPIIVFAGGSYLSNNNATGQAQVRILRVDNSAVLGHAQASGGVVNFQMPWSIRSRQSLAAGTYTFKLQLSAITAGTALLGIAANHPCWLTVLAA